MKTLHLKSVVGFIQEPQMWNKIVDCNIKLLNGRIKVLTLEPNMFLNIAPYPYIH